MNRLKWMGRALLLALAVLFWAWYLWAIVTGFPFPY